ncbi:MAG: glycosyltransferase family 25 protein [Pseudomonadota bacterium]|nr:glycosyltransferase family 25 protein [Pseudomonadota bacterium]
MLPDECACYLINLDRSPDRLETTSAHLAAAGIAFERVAGTDGMLLSDAQLKAQTRENRFYKPLRRGEVGCYLSHLEALRCFIASNQPYALILEDDVVLSEHVSALVAAAIQLRGRTNDARLAWDVLKLGNGRSRLIELAPLNARHWLVEYGPSVPIGAYAALWTRDGAMRWLQQFRGVSRPIDCDLQHPWEYGLCIRSVHPAPVTSKADSVMGSDILVTRSPWAKLGYEGRRLVHKWRYFVESYGWRFMLPWLWRKRLIYRS